MLKEFRDFIMRGNVLDLAIAVVIGGAFAQIVTSLVKDIITPVIGLIMGGINFSGLSYGVVTWGLFVQSIIDFLIIAFVIFLAVKIANKLKKAPPPADPTTKDCSYCFSVIPIKATRCPNCTSELK